MSMLNMLLGSGAKTQLKWSGDSIGMFSGVEYGGIQTSGNQWRHNLYIGKDYSGSWQTVSLLGVFSNSSIGSIYGIGIEVSGSSIRMHTNITNGNWISYTVATKSFTGGTSIAYDEVEGAHKIDSSGGLIRGSYAAYWFGQYISLT